MFSLSHKEVNFAFPDATAGCKEYTAELLAPSSCCQLPVQQTLDAYSFTLYVLNRHCEAFDTRVGTLVLRLWQSQPI